MIRHIVLTKFKPGTSEDRIAEIYDGLSAVADRLEGAHGFTGGRSRSPEQIERGYMHGFTLDFDDWDALARYASDPAHQALGAQLVENAVGGIDGILVLDIEI
ncbi:Dabb family protein [Tropicimonas sp. S265A]|uniref:Dabb family protein n=1 Tax=Tropicimonas sp. S265A TaxID=3415134 RepID=UPI003C7EC126